MDLEEPWREIQSSPGSHDSSLSRLVCASHSRPTPLVVELIYSAGRIQGKRTEFGMFGIWYSLRSDKKWGWPWEDGSDGGLGGHAREFGLHIMDSVV